MFLHRVTKILKLAAIADRLALLAGPSGITVSDVRMEAYRLGLLDGTERGRDLSFLSSVPVAAKLTRTARTRRSPIRVTHGNRQTVWIHPTHESPYAQ